MADEKTFDAAWDLLSNAVKAGRAEGPLLNEEKMGEVFKAYKEASRGTERNVLEADTVLSIENVRKLTTQEVKELLASERIESINGIERGSLKSRFDEVCAISNEELATKAVADALERSLARESRFEKSVKRLRKQQPKPESAQNEEQIKNVRERKRDI